MERGVEIVGRFVGVTDGKAQFSGSLRNHCAMADLKLERLLQRIDTWAELNGKSAQRGSPERFAATRVADAPRLNLDLKRGRIGTLIWATGYKPDYGWLRVPAFDRKGELRHDGGILPVPGLYVLGLNFMRRRKSSSIDGAADDVRDLSAHLAAYLHKSASPCALRAAG
jgi:putative flavoprotein involved in K+ transport